MTHIEHGNPICCIPTRFQPDLTLVRSYPSNFPSKLSVVCKLLKSIQFNLQHSCHLDFNAGLLKVRVSLLSSKSFGQHNIQNAAPWWFGA